MEKGMELYIKPTYSLLISIRYSALVQAVGCQLDLHPVSGEDPDIVHTHLAGDMAQNNMPILELYTKHRIGQSLYNLSVYFDHIIFCHFSSFCYRDTLRFRQYLRSISDYSHRMFVMAPSKSVFTDYRPLVVQYLRRSVLLTYHRLEAEDHAVFYFRTALG